MERLPRVMSVSGGKDGVGKTNVVANLALAFANLGKRVCVLDADLDLANVEILAGLQEQFMDAARGESFPKISELLIEGAEGILVAPVSPAGPLLADLDTNRKLYLLDEFEQLGGRVDILLIDAGTGVSPNVLFFNVAAQETIHVLTPDLSSVRCTHALIKMLATRYLRKEFTILVNQASTEEEALGVFAALHRLGEDSGLNLSLDYVGFVPFDEKISIARESKKTVLELFPICPSSLRFKELADFFLDNPIRKKGYENVQFFRDHLFRCDN